MRVIAIIVCTLLAFILGIISLYFFRTETYRIKTAIICLAFAMFFTCSASNMYNTFQLQRQTIYQYIFEDELIRRDTLCYEDGSLYDTQFFGETALVIQDNSTGFYRIHITRATKEGPRKIMADICCNSETIVNIDKNCRQPTVEEYIHHEYRINPEGKIYFEKETPKFILTIPPNTIKIINKSKGS